MKREDRKELQAKGDEAIRKQRGNKKPIIKTDSLNDRARKIGIATDMPALNREARRRDLKVAVRTETLAAKKKGK
jgi:hypothetical protein